VLLILKIVTPVVCLIPRYDGHIVQPEEGELHRRLPRGKKRLDPQAWSVNIDKTKGVFVIQRGLQLLWDT
jgi:hypothetical protein